MWRWLLGLTAALAVTATTMAQPIGRPRLVVVLVVDQLRADYLTTFEHRWRGGFRRLLDHGAQFVDAAYPYWSTITCAGHSTISTGTFPRTHGMVLNRWWDRDQRRIVACTDDASTSAISYGKPAAAGHSAVRLLAPTLADEIRRQQSGARVVSLSLKPRSAIGLAGHGGDAVTWFDESVGAFVTSRAFTPGPVPALQAFFARHPMDDERQLEWRLSQPADSYRYADVVAGERPNFGWTSLFPHPIGGPGVTDAAFADRWQKSPFSDAYLARMATTLISEWQLGRRDATDFLGISFSALDMVGHDFGPRSREIEDLLLSLDTTLGALLKTLDDTVGPDRYVLALSADHGVAVIPEQVSSGRIANEDIAQVAEQALVAHWGSPSNGSYVAAALGGQIYFAPGVFDRLRAAPAAMQAVNNALLGVLGVARVVRSDQIMATTTDPVIRAVAHGYMAGRSGDLFVIPKRDWIIEQRADADATTHGTMYDYDRRVPLILFGQRIVPGRYSSHATPADIAPTLANLAGIRMEHVEGRVLSEVSR